MAYFGKTAQYIDEKLWKCDIIIIYKVVRLLAKRSLTMGIYLNPGNQGFAESLNSQIYVDKTGLISYTNRVIGTAQKYICVSRPRRFGKTMAAGMHAKGFGESIS